MRPMDATCTWTGRSRAAREVSPPASQGFGMKLIRLTAAELGGGVELEFLPQGLKARITVRLN